MVQVAEVTHLISLADIILKENVIRFSTKKADTEEIIRSELLKNMQIGLLDYLKHTHWIKQVTFTMPKREAVITFSIVKIVTTYLLTYLLAYVYLKDLASTLMFLVPT